MATFITSKTSGSIYVSVNTTTGYWKSYHNGSYNGTSNTPQIYSDSGTFEQRSARLDITGSTGEFTIVSCDVNGNVSGYVTLLNLSGCDIISFDGTGLTGLTKLNIQEDSGAKKNLTSFDATGMTSLIWLYISNHSLTNVNVSGLVNLTKLVLDYNYLTLDGLIGLSTLSSLTWLNLDGNTLTQFDGTGLSSLSQLDLFYNQVTTSGITNLPNTLTKLNLRYNRLTTFDATSLTNLTNLILDCNQLTSVNLSGLTQLNLLNLSDNYLPSINVSGLTSLAHINLIRNRLTTIDVSGLTNLVELLLLYNHSITSSANNQILQQLDQNGAVGDTSTNKIYFPSNGHFSSSGGRTSAGNTSFNNLSSKNWDLDGVDLLTPPPTATFTTSKSVGETIKIEVYTTTGYWNYYHNGVSNGNTAWIADGSHTIIITSLNSQFTLFACNSMGDTEDEDGNVYGNIRDLEFEESGVGNKLTSVDVTGLSSLVSLGLSNNLLTTFDGTGLTNLVSLYLTKNLLTSFNSTGLTNLVELDLRQNQLTSFSGNGLGLLTELNLTNNPITTFTSSGMSNLTILVLTGNQLTSLNISGLTNLNELYIANLAFGPSNNITTSINNSILDVLNSNNVNGGTFRSLNGRTSIGTADYNSLISRGWTLTGVDLPYIPTFITSKSVGETLSIRVYSNTDYWKYYHNGVYSNVYQNQHVNVNIPVVNADGEFTLLPCDSQGNINGEIYAVSLSSGYGNPGNQVTSFDGSSLNLTDLDLSKNLLTSFSVTGMSNLTSLRLYDNLLTSFSGVGLDSLNFLELSKNPLTSFIGTGLSNLENLWLDDCKLLTSFNGTGLVNLTYLTLHYYVSYDQSSGLPLPSSLTSFIGGDMSKITTLDFTYWTNNSLTSFDATGLTGLTTLKLGNNTSLTSTTFNNSILDLLNSNSVNGGTFHSSKGRTSIGTADYNSLINRGWTLIGVDLPYKPTTFKTSKSVGQKINVYVNTSTGYWKYNHNVTDSSIFINGQQNNIKVTNVNGEFEIIPCDSNGIFSGVVTKLNLQNNRITQFDGTLGLTYLNLYGNRLTTFNGSGIPDLTYLNLYGNLLTSFNGSTLSSLTSLDLYGNRLTTFDGSGMSSLTSLNLKSNRLTTFNGSGMSNLTYLDLHTNRLTTFNSSGMSNLTSLDLYGNRLTTFNGTGLSNLTYLNLYGNRLTTFNGTGLSSLTSLNLHANRLTTFITTGLSSLNYLNLYGNRLTQFDGTSLSSLTDLDLSSNRLTTFNGAGLSSLTKLNLYGNQLTTFIGGNMGLITSLNFQTWNITTLTTFSCAGLSSLTYLYMVYNTGISSIINNQILQDLNTNGLSNGTFMSNNGRTSLSNSNYTSLINKNWTFNATPNPTIYANGLNVFSWRSFDDDEIIGLPGDTWGDITTDEIPGLYSLQRISGTYSGPAIQVRRSYDNALMDIGFTTDGSLDLTTIYSFVGTASGYLTTFYDQTAAPDNNLTQPQTSTQPIIVSNGVPVSFQMPGADTTGATASQPAQFNWWRKKGKIIKNLSKPITMNITEISESFAVHFIDWNGNEVKNFSKPVSAEYNSY